MYRRDFLAGAGAAGLATTNAASTAFAATARRGRALRRQHIVTDDGTELFYRDWGQGAPVLFLNGWALPSDGWRYVMLPLREQGMRCIAYDRRGHGRSSDPGAGYDYDTLADDLHSAIETLDLNGVTIVAHSFGGGEAVRYMTRHGSKRISRLVLLGTTLPFIARADDNPHGIDPAIVEKVRREQWMTDFSKWMDDNARPFVVPSTSTAMIEWIKAQMLTCSLQAAIEVSKTLMSTDFRRELPNIAVPTLLLHGDRDASAPIALTSRVAVDLLPNAHFKLYEGGPHGLQFTHPAEVARDIAQFAGR